MKTGKRDIGISAITINDARKKLYDFSGPYFDSSMGSLATIFKTKSLLEPVHNVPIRGIENKNAPMRNIAKWKYPHYH
nr:transporter substrate-binding domain-containing protein [Aneurinibacillus tyrosinisolvens]